MEYKEIVYRAVIFMIVLCAYSSNMSYGSPLSEKRIKTKDAPLGWWLLALVAFFLLPPIGLCMLLVRPCEFETVSADPIAIDPTVAQSEEATYISARRRESGVANVGSVGLALSGGGIRSACFSLGVLRWLEQSGKIREIDYISSVSGGGYAATSFLRSQEQPLASTASISRAEIARGRLLKAEGYLEAGIGRLLRTACAILISSALSLSPILSLGYSMLMMSHSTTHGEGWTSIAVFVLFLVGSSFMAWRAGAKDKSDTVLWASLAAIFGAMALLTFLKIENFLQVKVVQFILIALFVVSILWLLRVPRHKGIRQAQKYAKIILLPLGYVLLELTGLVQFDSPWIYFVALPLALMASLSPWFFSCNSLNFPFSLYADGLRKTFSGKIDEISILKEGGAAGPLHIFNCCLHSTESNDPDTRERGGCNFFITKLHCGSKETGAYSTKTWRMLGGRSPHLDVWRLAAISGAAIDGHGVRQSPLMNALLSFGNIGLGQWVINPSSKCSMRKGAPGLILNFFAALGARSGNGTWIRLSDGGHFENLGIYELVRRRCAEIIVVDAGHDPNFDFVDMARAATLCFNDFGAEIDIPCLKPGKANGGGKCVYEGVVAYADGSKAALTYIKLTVGSSHPLRLRLRSSFDKNFPHEPTRNQQVTRDFIDAYFYAGMHAAQEAIPSRNLAT
jgi:Ca2+/Na+ antiporter